MLSIAPEFTTYGYDTILLSLRKSKGRSL